MRTPIRLYALIIFLAIVLLRLPLFWTPILDVDEAIYGLFAKIWFAGGIPYRDCVETKPLGIYFLFGSVFKYFGAWNMIAVHAFTIVWVALTSYVVYLTVRLFGSTRAALLAALFYGVFTTTYTPKMIATTIEPILMLPLCLQIYLWLMFERSRKFGYALLSGVALSAALLLKYQAGINLVLMAGYLFIIYPLVILEMNLKTRLRATLIFIIGLIPLPLLMFGYISHVGAMKDFIFWTISGSLQYINEGSLSINLGKQLLTRVLPFIAATTLLWVLLLPRIQAYISRIQRKASTYPLNNAEWLILLWLILSIIPVSAGKRFYGHYFILLLPPLAMLAGQQLDLWWQAGRSKVLKAFVIIGVLLPAIGCLIPRYMMDKTYKAFGEDNPRDYRAISTFISNHTTEDQRIAVWGFAPLIYWYSERLPATRFFWSDLLAGRVPGSKDYTPIKNEGTKIFWEMFFEDMEKHQPAMFIDTASAGLHDYGHFPIKNYPELQSYLDKHYKTEVILNGATIYRRLPSSQQ